MKKIGIKNVIYYSVGLFFLALMIAIQIQLNVGIGPWDAFGLSISHLTGFKVGDVAIIQAFICIGIQFVLLKKDFRWISLLSFIFASLTGKITNLFYYGFIENIIITNYALRIVLYIVSVMLIAFFASMLQTAHVTPLPLEAMCQAFADKGFGKFSTIRQIVDIICVLVVLFITYILKQPLTLGLGTIISLLMFGPLMGIYIPHLKKFTDKYINN